MPARNFVFHFYFFVYSKLFQITGGHGGTAPTLMDVIQRFKSFSTAEYRKGVKKNNWPPFSGKLWQRSYYEHIIRNDESLYNIRKYIQENPMKWDVDPENPYRSNNLNDL